MLNARQAYRRRIVWRRPEGITRFSIVQAVSDTGYAALVFYLFDLCISTARIWPQVPSSSAKSVSWGNRSRARQPYVEPAEPVHQGRIMGVFIGLDVSLNKAAVCVVDRDGVVLWQGKVPSEPGPLITRLAEWSGKIDLAGIEACPLSGWLHRGLCEAGILVVCIETRHAQRFLSPRPVKTDRNDARGLAEMMRLGHYRPAHVESPAAQSMRNNACRPDAARLGAVANRKHHPRPIEALRSQDRRNPSEPLCGSGRRVARDGRYV